MTVSSEEHQELIATAARLRDRAKAAEARLEQAEAWIRAAMETGDSGLVAALKQAEAERDMAAAIAGREQAKRAEAAEAECEVLRQQRDTLAEAIMKIRDEWDGQLGTGQMLADFCRSVLASSLVVVDPSDPSLAVPHFTPSPNDRKAT